MHQMNRTMMVMAAAMLLGAIVSVSGCIQFEQLLTFNAMQGVCCGIFGGDVRGADVFGR